MRDNALARHFGRQVRGRRVALGKTQFTVAIENGFSISHLSKIECGIVEVKLTTMARLADSLGVPLVALLDNASQGVDISAADTEDESARQDESESLETRGCPSLSTNLYTGRRRDFCAR